MNSKIITGLLIYTSLFSMVGAMEMATGSDSMVKDKMMVDSTMMKKDKMMDSGKMMKSTIPTSDAGIGSRGEHVTAIQKFLIEKGFLTLPAGVMHGYYGSMTKKAVMAYQESIGVTGTGYFGPKTRMMMQDKMKMMDDGKMMKKDDAMIMKDTMVQ